MISKNQILHMCLLSLATLAPGVFQIANAAQVYKCVDKAGKTEYQSQPCPETSRSTDIDIRQTSPLSDLPQISSMSGARNLITSYCMSSSTSNSGALRNLYIEQPQKIKTFCECVADYSLSDINKLKHLAESNNRAGLQQMGLNAAVSCSSHLLNKDASPALPQSARLSSPIPVPIQVLNGNSTPADPSQIRPGCQDLVDQIAKVQPGTNWESLAKKFNTSCPGIAYECNNYKAHPENNKCEWVKRTGSNIMQTKNYP